MALDRRALAALPGPDGPGAPIDYVVKSAKRLAYRRCFS